MKRIEPEAIPELKIMPWLIGLLLAFGLLALALNRRTVAHSWLIMLGLLGLWDFWRWEYDYGHNLDPAAAIKVPGMAYQSPLIGRKQLLNFTAESWPHSGGILAGHNRNEPAFEALWGHERPKGLNLSLPEGRVTALLGPNASGKTTFIKCILGLAHPSRGTIRVFGETLTQDPSYRKRIGYMPQKAAFPPNLTLGELVALMGRLRKGKGPYDKELFEALGLKGHVVPMPGAGALWRCGLGALGLRGYRQG